jgi:hypothetical protein
MKMPDGRTCIWSATFQVCFPEQPRNPGPPPGCMQCPCPVEARPSP